MPLSSKEKQSKYRAKMRARGYKLVQVWARDKEAQALREYEKALENGLHPPRASIKDDRERVSLEISVKSEDIAVRNRIVYNSLHSLLSIAAEKYKNREIPKYVYLDIVELLRPLAGIDMYRLFKTMFEFDGFKRLKKRQTKFYKSIPVDVIDHLAECLDIGL
jgi:hypothetical protein